MKNFYTKIFIKKFYSEFGYPSNFLYKNCLSDKFSFRKFVVHKICYFKIFHAQIFLYENLLSTIFSVRKIYYTSFYKKTIYTKICYPKNFLYENCLSTKIFVWKLVTHKIYYTINCYPQHFP